VSALGIADIDALTALLTQVVHTIPDVDKNPNALNLALATLHDIGPKDAIERLLAVQMVGVHLLAMEFLRRSIRFDQLAQFDSSVNAANKLLRTFTILTEALNRHRGKGGQPMVVGSVNVSQGGQAIVGSVNPARPEKEPTEREPKVQ